MKRRKVRNTSAPLYSRRRKNRTLTRLNRLRIYLQPFFRVYTQHYNIWIGKLEAIIFILVILSVPTGYIGHIVWPIIIFYIYVCTMVIWRIFMNWDFFYMACNMIALKLELGLTKNKGFHNRFKGVK